MTIDSNNGNVIFSRTAEDLTVSSTYGGYLDVTVAFRTLGIYLTSSQYCVAGGNVNIRLKELLTGIEGHSQTSLSLSGDLSSLPAVNVYVSGEREYASWSAYVIFGGAAGVSVDKVKTQWLTWRPQSSRTHRGGRELLSMLLVPYGSSSASLQVSGPRSISAEGGSLNISVSSTDTTRLISASPSSQSWATITKESDGTGYAVFRADIDENTATESRQVTFIFIQGTAMATLDVTQAAAEEAPVVGEWGASPSSISAAYSGQNSTITITTPTGMESWILMSEDKDIVALGASGQNEITGAGNSSVTFQVKANTAASARGCDLTLLTPDRQYILDIHVTQAAAPASEWGVSPSSISASASGLTGTITITTPTGSESWVLDSSDSSVITLADGKSSASSQMVGSTVYFAVSQNSTTSARSATLTLRSGGQTKAVIQVTQAAAEVVAELSASPDAIVAPSSGSTGVIHITSTDSSVHWYLMVDDASTTIVRLGSRKTGYTNGYGSTDVAYEVSENIGDSVRSTNINLSTSTSRVQVIPVNQLAPSVEPTGVTAEFTDGATQSVLESPYHADPINGATIWVNVYDPDYVGWKALFDGAEDAPLWLTISGNTEGQGAGDFYIIVEELLSLIDSRSCTVTIGDTTFTIIQES